MLGLIFHDLGLLIFILFVNYGNLYNKTNCKKYFDLPNTNLKKLYLTIKNELNPINLSDIYTYSKEVNNLDEFCRGYEEKILIDEHNGKFNRKHMIFFPNFDFKRLFRTKHILLDGKYLFPKGFS